MGVEFRWQVESEDEWRAPEAPAKPRRPFPWRVVGILLLLLLAGLGIAAGHFWQQARRGEECLKRELSTAANLEAQALREGDHNTFLSLQDPDDSRWYDWQKERIPSWHGFVLEPGQEANLAVLDAALLPGNRAWAEVAWAMEDGIYHRVQFYRQATGHWLRTGARREHYGGERTRETAHFAFKYLARDEPTVAWMAEQFEAWYAAACADLDCSDSSRINVLVTPDGETGSEFRWAKGFVVNSPRLRGVREDGLPLPQERKALARIVMSLLVVQHANGLGIGQQPYLLPQSVNWEMQRLGLAEENTPTTPVLDAVMASHGIEGVRALLTAMGQTNSEHEALHQAVGETLESLNVVFGQYLTALLALERQMMEWQAAELVSPASTLLAHQIFGALLAKPAGSWHTEKTNAFREWRNGQDTAYTSTRPLSHPIVERWEKLDDSTLWADVSYWDVTWDFPRGTILWRMEFFDQVNGDWRHAPPSALSLGEEVTLNSEHFCILCHEREVELMVRELAQLEALYRQIADAVQTELPPSERLTVQITTGPWSHVDYDKVDAQMVSPYLSAWGEEPGVSYLVDVVRSSLIQKLIDHSDEFTKPSGAREMWWEMTLGIWQWLTAGAEPARWAILGEVEPFVAAVRSDELVPLDRLGQVTFSPELVSNEWIPEGWTEDEAMLLYIEAATVLGYAGETYGLQVFPALLRTLPEANSLESWLQTVLGVDLKTFEASWRAWLREQVGQGF